MTALPADFVERFAALLRQPRPWPGLVRARGLTTERLKELWDSYDGAETADPEICGEDVHYVLNERGEGDYCCV